jgi:subtilisin family serine protease
MNSEELRVRPVRNWRSRILVGLSSIAIAATSFITPANATDPAPITDTWQAAAEAASATPAELRAEVADGSLKLVVVRNVEGSPVIETTFLNSRVDLEKTLNQLNSDPSVVSVEPESQVRAFSTPPYFTSQWGLTTLASSSVSETTQGSGITVAVIDSGVDANNPDLVGRVTNGIDYRDGISYLNSKNLIDSCVSYTDAVYSGRPTHADFGKYDPHGHGTHVAGIITSNGIGIKSVAPMASIMPVRVLSALGTGDMSDVACGIIYAADHGAKVINLSLSSSSDSAALRATVSYAVSQGVLVVAAAGNGGPTAPPSYPAAYPDVIGVGAINQNSMIASFSNVGDYVDVVAPGVGIWSTCSSPSTVCTTSDGDPNYESLSGTSMAAPFVSGLAALIFAMDAKITNAEAASIITTSSIDKGASGYDYVFGYGLVNAPAAVTKSAEYSLIIAQRILTEQAAADKLAADQKAAADKLAADQKAAADKLVADAAAAEATRLASLPVVQSSLVVKSIKKKKISISVAAPSGSKTFVQRKVGKKWKTVVTTTAVPTMVIKVSKAGTYRVRIEIPAGTVTSKSYKVK